MVSRAKNEKYVFKILLEYLKANQEPFAQPIKLQWPLRKEKNK